MNKAFIKENDTEDVSETDQETSAALPAGGINYITAAGYKRLKDEFLHLLNTERPEVVKVVSWAASNGDRSENGDYLYGKKRLREIDRRLRFLTQRLDSAQIVDPALQTHHEQIFFGATVIILREDGSEQKIRIVGVDEVDPSKGDVSWISPIARALLKAREGDTVVLQTPHGPEQIEVLAVNYPMS